jgi:hypothetical protein
MFGSTILRAPAGSLGESLIWSVWDVIVEELQSNQVDIMIDGLCRPECLDEDIGTILRHLTLARLSGW